MTSHDLSTFLAAACAAAQKAADVMKKAREERSYRVDFKGVRDLVTSADLAAQEVILATLEELAPATPILSEEHPIPQDLDPHGPLWIIDPIDGTTNFAHGLFYCASSIAYACDGEIQVGVVTAPFLGETFVATKGEGAFRNGEPIAATETDSLNNALVTTGFPYRRELILEELFALLEAVISNCRDLRRTGSAALDLCEVAVGRTDGYYETLRPWDAAAGRLIATEAGAATSAFSLSEPTGDSWEGRLPSGILADGLIVANPTLLPQLEALVASALDR